MIELENVSKNYGKTVAIDNMSLKLKDNKIYCLLGRNGAGKTTFMKLLAGRIKPTDGVILNDGKAVGTLNMPQNVQYIESSKTQFNMSVKELISLASNLNTDFDLDFANKMVDKFNLNKHKKYNSLSFGMKTMVTTIISLATNSKVVLLDEPVLGFDAIMRREFYSLLAESFEYKPRIIIVSTHLIDEISNTAQQILIIDNGKILLNDDIVEVTEKAYKVSGIGEEVENATKGLFVLKTEEIGKFTVNYVYDNRIFNNSNVEITNLSLEDLFVNLVGGENL